MKLKKKGILNCYTSILGNFKDWILMAFPIHTELILIFLLKKLKIIESKIDFIELYKVYTLNSSIKQF